MTRPRQQLAAGMVVVRRGPGGTRVLLLHHKGQGEWRLPKGKLEAGESAAQAAERELSEESGLQLRAGRLLGATVYALPDGQATRKIVFFFAADAGEEARVELESTFDAFEWLPPAEAISRLSWPNEAGMAARAVQA